MKSLLQKILAVLTYAALLLALIGLVGLWQIHRLATGLGVQSLDYRIATLTFYSVQFSRLSFRYDAANIHHQVSAEDLALQWEWPAAFTPQVLSLDIERLHWHMQRDDDIPVATASSPFTLPADWSIPDVLPASTHIRSAHLVLPCPVGECYLTGNLDVQREDNKVNAHGKFSPGKSFHQHYIDITADYQLNQQLPTLNLHMAAGDGIHALLQTQLMNAGALSWSSRLTATARYPDAWLLTALADWHISFDNQWQTINQPMALRAQWQLDVEPLLRIDTSPWHKLINGYAELDVEVKSPIAVEGVGKFSGDAALRIKAVDGTLEAYDMSADVTVIEPVLPPALQPLGLDIERLDIHTQSQSTHVSFADLPVELAIKTVGESHINITMAGSVNTLAKTVRLPEIKMNAHVQHPQLHTKPWQWHGSMQGGWEKFSADGELTINNALVISHQLKRNPDEVQVDWQLQDSFLLAGNPFADLIKAWPPLLSLTQGKVKGEGRIGFDLEKNILKKASASLVMNDISGIYDTTIFQGLTTNLSLSAGPQVFTLNTDELRVKQINKGFVLGPLTASGGYTSEWQKPVDGKLSLQGFHMDVIGGSVTTPAQVFDLSQSKQSLMLTLDNIDLGLLLQQHPSTELSGSGRISGTVPIEITATGVSIPKGMVAARPPGGQLQLHSDRAEALAKSQPSMKLITDALEDFHYTVLASEVSYDEEGKLLLGLRLEGRNPALENGRPVHFNITLEEDLPAMITSIQLSSQISDVVKKRLQEHLQKRSTR